MLLHGFNIRVIILREKVISLEPLSLKMATHKGVKILCISVIRISERVWLMHRIYDEQNIIILDEELTKN